MENAAKWIEFAVLFAAFIAAGWYVRRWFGGVTVAVAEVQRRLQGGERLLVLDVRTPAEFVGEHGHIDGALNISLADLGARLSSAGGEIGRYRDTPVVLVCRSGSRAHAAARMLRRAGLRDVAVMSGGMIGWNARRLPVARQLP